MAQLRIEEIWIYPVKSCRGIALDAAMLAPRGLAGDREWMLVDAAGRFITQRTHPQLARIVTSLDERHLTLNAPGMAALTLPRDAASFIGATKRVVIWRDEVDALDAGDDAARWCSAVAAAPVRLIRASDATQREPEVRWRGTTAAPVNFPDGFPLLVCNTASLAELNRRMGAELPMSRFRPNIVISGPAAFAEDEISELRSGEVTLRLVKPCSRCSTTTVDQLTGIPGSDPLPTLKQFRFNRELLGVTFGMNTVIVAGIGKELRLGTATSSG